MPKAAPPLPPTPPAPLRDGEAAIIKEVVARFFGPDAVVRNFGPDPDRLELDVETSLPVVTREPDDCLGVLNCLIDRERIGLRVSRRGTRDLGSAKIAYRQGVVV